MNKLQIQEKYKKYTVNELRCLIHSYDTYKLRYNKLCEKAEFCLKAAEIELEARGYSDGRAILNREREKRDNMWK